MAKAESIPTTKESIATQVAHELFELEDQFLRVRDLTYAVRMLASSPDVSKEATSAIEALSDAILGEIGDLIEERTRLCHLAAGKEGAAQRPVKGDGPIIVPGCSWEFHDGVIWRVASSDTRY
jgi:hypothetical protein